MFGDIGKIMKVVGEMKRKMPKQYKHDPGLKWLTGDAIAVDWADVVSDRGTILGDAALQGAEMAPLGAPMFFLNSVLA